MNLTERREIYINYTLFCIDFAEVSKRPHKSTFVVYMFNELLLLHCIANMVGIHNSHHAYSDSDAKLCLACSKQQDLHCYCDWGCNSSSTNNGDDGCNIGWCSRGKFTTSIFSQSIVAYKFISTSVFLFSLFHWNVKYFCILVALGWWLCCEAHMSLIRSQILTTCVVFFGE